MAVTGIFRLLLTNSDLDTSITQNIQSRSCDEAGATELLLVAGIPMVELVLTASKHVGAPCLLYCVSYYVFCKEETTLHCFVMISG